MNFILSLLVFDFACFGFSSSNSNRIHSYALPQSSYLLSFHSLYTVCTTRPGCAIHCSKYWRCDGFKFTSGSCVLFRLKKRPSNLEQNIRGTQYLYLKKTETKRFGSLCLGDHECDYGHGKCLDHSCACVIGYSYDFNNDKCVTRCSRYGDTFSKFKSSGVNGCNTGIKRVHKAANCKKFCLEAKGFVCISAELKTSGHCLICGQTWHSLKEHQRRYGNEPEWDLYYRHCHK